VSGATPIKIFYGDVPRSVRATMLFPADQEKARIVAGWAIARSLHSAAGKTADELVAIARDAAAFVNIRDDVGQREGAGQAVGEVIKVLFAMTSMEQDRNVASFESAIQVVESAVVEAGERTSRTTLSASLTLLRPALHLWGAWSLEGRRWPSTSAEADALVERAGIILQQLVDWNIGRKGVPSIHLNGEFLHPYHGWQSTGLRLYPPRLRRDDVPVRRGAGRPKSRPAKNG
jgi:hypothetical protein